MEVILSDGFMEGNTLDMGDDRSRGGGPWQMDGRDVVTELNHLKGQGGMDIPDKEYSRYKRRNKVNRL